MTFWPALIKSALSGVYWIGSFVIFHNRLFAGLFGDEVDANFEIVEPPSLIGNLALFLALIAGWVIISAMFDRMVAAKRNGD